MVDMFNNAHNFNQDISNWNVSNVKYMGQFVNDKSNFVEKFHPSFM
jgi:surface protein